MSSFLIKISILSAFLITSCGEVVSGGCGSSGFIPVSTQLQFAQAISDVQNGTTVSIKLAKGTYYIQDPIKTTASLSIKGSKATIKLVNDCYCKADAIRQEDGFYVCPLKSDIPAFSLFLDDKDHIIPLSESVNDSTHVNLCQDILGEFQPKSGCEIQIPLVDNDITAIGKKAYGYFDCGWTTGNFYVRDADDSYIYGTTLNSLNTGRFNYEKTAYRHDIRYVLYNSEKKAGCIYYDDKYIYIPEKYKNVYLLKNTSYTSYTPTLTANADLVLDGVTFKNFNGIKVNSKPSDECIITNCHFENTLGNALYISKKSGDDLQPCIVEGCTFTHCSLLENHVINLTGNFANTISMYVRDCSLNRYEDEPLMYKNTTGCIWVHGDAEITGCTVYNTPRAHLYFNRGNIIAKDNVAFNTDGFNAYKDRNLSNDFGLIYCNHFTSNTQEAIANRDSRILIENCLLYGAEAHANDARGIMIDDGRGDVTCRNNVIYNTGVYSIDSRECAKFIGSSSVRNVYEGNVVTEKYKLQGGAELSASDRPVSKGNIVLTGDECKISAADIQKEDLIVENAGVKGIRHEKLCVSPKTKKAIRKAIGKDKYNAIQHF